MEKDVFNRIVDELAILYIYLSAYCQLLQGFLSHILGYYAKLIHLGPVISLLSSDQRAEGLSTGLRLVWAI